MNENKIENFLMYLVIFLVCAFTIGYFSYDNGYDQGYDKGERAMGEKILETVISWSKTCPANDSPKLTFSSEKDTFNIPCPNELKPTKKEIKANSTDAEIDFDEYNTDIYYINDKNRCFYMLDSNLCPTEIEVNK